ncbi:MAG: GDP-mannose 4,6-dehydratase, partial [Rhodothermales bacterium]|nr:GDP-mannose 4,6-dehydratase [Rhodothermales bacterium]
NPPTLTAETHFRVNSLGLQALLDALKEQPQTRVVSIGSAAVYGSGRRLTESSPLEPSNIYGASKAAGTIVGCAYAKVYGIGFVELRLFSAFGPWERARRLIPYSILCALAGTAIRLSDGAQQRDFLYVDDVVDALISAARTSLPPGTVLNVCSGVGRPVEEIVDTVLEVMGKSVPILKGERTTRSDEIWEMSGDSSAAEAVLGWTPKTDFREGLRKTAEWFESNRDIVEDLA